MNTRSVKSSHVPGLSASVTASDGLSPWSPNATRLGPMAPRFRYTDAAPGSAVERERHRPVAPVHRVRGEDDVGALLAVAAVDGQGADRRGVLQRLAIELDRLFGVRVRRKRRLHLLRLRLGGRRRWLFCWFLCRGRALRRGDAGPCRRDARRYANGARGAAQMLSKEAHAGSITDVGLNTVGGHASPIIHATRLVPYRRHALGLV